MWGGGGRDSQKSFGGASGKPPEVDPLVPPPLSSFLLPGSVGLQLEGVSGSPGGLVKTPVAGPHPRSF